MITLEVCANSVQSAIEAQKGGASRIELCDNLPEGGTTPSYAQIKLARQKLDIKLHVIIRPRGGDFVYNDLELEIMKEDIRLCGEEKCDGVVFGVLDSKGFIDKKKNKELINIAHKYKMDITFHRAFDRSNNLFTSLEDIINLGCTRILTSGGKENAMEGKTIIADLIKTAAGRIVVMPGGGITENNICDLVKETGLKEFHGSFRSQFRTNMEYISPTFNMENEYTIMQTDAQKVKQAIKNANRNDI